MEANSCKVKGWLSSPSFLSFRLPSLPSSSSFFSFSLSPANEEIKDEAIDSEEGEDERQRELEMMDQGEGARTERVKVALREG